MTIDLSQIEENSMVGMGLRFFSCGNLIST